MARLTVRVTPRAGRDEVVGWRDGVLFVRVKAPPEGGRANEGLLRLLAGAGLRDARIVSGSRSRTKLIDAPDIDESVLASLFPSG